MQDLLAADGRPGHPLTHSPGPGDAPPPGGDLATVRDLSGWFLFRMTTPVCKPAGGLRISHATTSVTPRTATTAHLQHAKSVPSPRSPTSTSTSLLCAASFFPRRTGKTGKHGAQRQGPPHGCFPNVHQVNAGAEELDEEDEGDFPAEGPESDSDNVYGNEVEPLVVDVGELDDAGRL